MYVSRPVRSIRDDPVAGETVRLLVTLADDLGERSAAVEASVRETVSAHGGEVLADLEFDTLAVEVPHEAVTDLCGLEGLAAIETDDTLSMTLDGAGEDVEYDG
jgi:hypothetical protein